MKKKIFLILRFIVSFGLIGYIFYKIKSGHNLSELPTYYIQANYLWLAGAVLLLMVLLVAGALRWGLLLSAQKVKLKPVSIFMYFMIGMFFNNFLPSTVGGDAIKVYYLSRFTKRLTESFISVVMDRIMGMAGLCVIALATLLWGGKQLLATVDSHNGILIFLITGGLSGALILFFAVVFSEKIMNFFFKLIKWEKIREKIRKLHQAVYIYKKNWKVLIKALGISTLIWILIVLVCWMVYMAFRANIPYIPMGYFFLFLPSISVIMSIPVSLAGLGTREAFFIIFFTTLPGIKELDALMISLNFYFVFLVASSFGGIIYILKDQLHFHRQEITGMENQALPEEVSTLKG